MGNICRSPAAENVMRRQLEQAGLADAVRCDSAGTIGYHAGNPPDPRMAVAGRRRGLPMTGAARQVTAADIDAFDLVLAMDEANLRDLKALASPASRHKLRPFCSYLARHREAEVPDPYYGGAQGFEHVLDLLEDGCSQILKTLAP